MLITTIPYKGCYPERDGGLWYVVTATHDSRLGEDFRSKDAAIAFLKWLQGEPMPDGWEIENRKHRHCDLVCQKDWLHATIWTAVVAEWFPARAAEVLP